MYHLRLIKALSYSGIVEATKQRPDVFVKDKATADKAVVTGYFQLENSEALLPDNGENSDDSIPDSIMLDGEDGTDDPIPDGVISGNDESGEDSAPADEQPKGKTLDEMSRAELETFATYKNVSVKGLPRKADIVAKLREVLGSEETSGVIEYGSPTMAELQQEY